MRSLPRWFLSICVMTALVDAGLERDAAAQPTSRDHRTPRADPPPPAPPPPGPVRRDHRQPSVDPPPPGAPAPDGRRSRRPSPGAQGPRTAPPAAKPETPSARAGYVFVRGHWDWRADTWKWVAGHWERERAGKSWREARWEQRGDRWVLTRGAWIDATSPPAVTPPAAGPGDRRPREAPPSPRQERQAARAGYVWASGQWDWRGDKWEWVAGHWERERAGKSWRPARWEQRDGYYVKVDGAWVDGSAPPAVTPATPAPAVRDHRSRRWQRHDRPVVSSYWPIKGKPGSRITIRGRNFAPDTAVVWAGQPIRGAKITPTLIRFQVPGTAASGAIALRSGDRRRDLAVGMFEVAAAFDAEAEQRRIEAERRKAAEAAWAARQRDLAKDRAAREAAVKERWADRAATREQRRAERIAAIQARWERAFLADAETQDELALHAQRSAELDRMRDIAELRADGKLVVRIDMMRSREDDRHSRRMASLQASFGAGGSR